MAQHIIFNISLQIIIKLIFLHTKYITECDAQLMIDFKYLASTLAGTLKFPKFIFRTHSLFILWNQCMKTSHHQGHTRLNFLNEDHFWIYIAFYENACQHTKKGQLFMYLIFKFRDRTHTILIAFMSLLLPIKINKNKMRHPVGSTCVN